MTKTIETLMRGRTAEEVVADALFNHGILAGNGDHPQEVAVALADRLAIDVRGDVSALDPACIRTAARNIGLHVPEPFYRGFPESVRELPAHALLVDQLLNYMLTYGIGNFEGPSSHSLVEAVRERMPLDDRDVVWRQMTVMGTDEAREKARMLATSTCAATRPASDEELALVCALMESDPCFEIPQVTGRDTRVRLAEATRDTRIVRQLETDDVIVLVRLLSDAAANGTNRINLRNQDRKLVTMAIDHALEVPVTGSRLARAFERRARWCAILHHVHYRPRNAGARKFVAAMRSGENHGDLSRFERLMAEGDVVRAARFLAESKGQGALLRNLDYVASRASEGQLDVILEGMRCDDPGQLLQLLAHCQAEPEPRRSFVFSRSGLVRTHVESDSEVARRRTRLSPEVRGRIARRATEMLADSLAGRLGRVYVDEGLARVAVPVSAAGANDGTGTLPAGSRIPVGGKVVRAFTYWERIDDIDLSMMGLSDDGGMTEFSWRTMYERQGSVAFSGDVTNGYHGGSEYFDLDLDAIRKEWPSLHYLVLADNVYSSGTFDQCDVRAGFMLRTEPKSGEVFEPKTVATSFAVTGRSRFAYLFAIDLETDEMVWLGITRSSHTAVAGAEGMGAYAFLDRWFHATEALSLADVATMAATYLVSDPAEADVAFVLDPTTLPEGIDAEVVTPTDTARIRELLS